MYNEAIETLQEKANNLKAEMRSVVKNAKVPNEEMTLMIFGYQNRINELSDAILTLKSIEEDEEIDNKKE